MKFTINRDLLLEALNNVSRGLSTKTPMPVLTGIKIEVSNERFILTTTNREVSVRVTLLPTNEIELIEEGTCVVPGKYFIDIIKKLEGKNVEFTLFEENTIKIISERTTFTLIALDHSNFPNINFERTGKPITLESQVLKQIIKQTSFAAGVSESRITLTGVCFEINQDKLQAIATDSYRLSKKVINIANEYPKTRINIPSKALEELCKILEDGKEVVEMYFINNRALFIYKNITFITRLIEGNFPDTSSIIPNEHLLSLTFNKNELISTVDRASLFTNLDNSSIVKLVVNVDNTIQIASNSNEIGKVVDEIIPIKSSNICRFQIAFSAKYFLEAIKAFDTNEVTIKFTGEIKPFVLDCDTDKDFIQVILPVRIF